MPDNIKLGVTLYSYSNEFVTQAMDLKELLMTVKAQGYDGVEFIPAQMAPEYPFLSDEWLEYFKLLLQEIGLQPVCWSAYIDMGIRTDRDMTEQEIIQYTVNDLIYAKKAGFPMVRTQHAISTKIFRSMIPICRELDMKLTIEMHHPHHPAVPVWQEYIKLMRGEGKGVLGFVPDFSIFQEMPHALFIKEALESGCRKEKLDEMILKHRQMKSSDEVLEGDYTQIEKQYGEQLEEAYNHPATLGQLKEIIDCVFYIHGKFYYLPEDLHDECIPYDRILPVLKECGYNGYIACEYEGHHFDQTVSAVEQLTRFVAMCNKILTAH